MHIRYAGMRSFAAVLLVAGSTLYAADQASQRSPFDEAYARLTQGRDYTSRRTGRIDLPAVERGHTLDNVLEVPAEYDPARRWPLRVALHGGVGRPAPEPGDSPRPLTNRVPSAGELVLHPRAWAGFEWWTWRQVEHIARLVERVKRDYNVDESRTYVTGISDGGTGVYFLAMREATLWAVCLPQNGHPAVLANPDVGADGQLFAGNLANCPMRVVNGGRDQLYPAASVTPWIERYRRAGIPIDFQVYPEAGHDVRWWPEERPRFEAFLASHRRVAHPDRVSWETERTDRYNRFRWLVIDRLAARSPGHADVVRTGNTYEARTRGVAAFTLLLSPEAVDFEKPVRVTVNGRVVHDGRVSKSVATLEKWADRDHDRTMLYGAELRVAVP